MAWSSPRTWVTGETVTAAQMNAHVRDNLDALNPLDSVAATSWSPTLEAVTTDPTTNGAPLTGTGRYWRVGPLVYAAVQFNFANTISAGSGIYFAALPVAASGINSSSNSGAGQVIGGWKSRDNSATSNNRGGLVLLSASDEVRFEEAGSSLLVTNSQPFAWAQDDVLSFFVTYPAA